MRIFAIRDDSTEDKVLGFLIYYEPSKSFYIELSDSLDPWAVPPVLSSFVNRGIYSIDSIWSERWVRQRIVPQDRQNIGEILRDNGLKEYDEFSLLLLTMGRCEQDDCYLEEISTDHLPELLARRWQTKVEDVVPLELPRLLVFFRNGMAKIVDTTEIACTACTPYLATQDRFNSVEVQPGGYGIYWKENDRIRELRIRQMNEYEKYVNGEIAPDVFTERRVKIRNEINELLAFVEQAEAENKRQTEESIRNKWFLDHSKGELSTDMVKDLIEEVVVGDEVEVRFC